MYSNRGSQFASEAYRTRLNQYGFLLSMSRKGELFDNAPMKSFSRSFKVENINHQPTETIEQATRAIADYINRFYNLKRKHSSLGYHNPIDFETGQLPELTLCN